MASNRVFEDFARLMTDASQVASGVRREAETAMKSQLDQINAQLTTQGEKQSDAVADKTLSGKMTKFAQLDLEERIAEKRYATAVAAVEAARILSERRMLYLHEIVPPALPEEYEYPRRLLSIAMVFVASIIAWAGAIAAMAFVRNHMA